jgi:predicted ATPase with chaperone activity
VGGGNLPHPGEISLAHRGVLFLDELPEFGMRMLEVLRQPIEDKVVTVSRAQGTLTFPANFMLNAALMLLSQTGLPAWTHRTAVGVWPIAATGNRAQARSNDRLRHATIHFTQ